MVAKRAAHFDFDSYFNREAFSNVSLDNVAQLSASPSDIVTIKRYEESVELPEKNLVLSWAYANCATDGTHIDDVHFDARKALKYLQNTPQTAIDLHFLPDTYQNYLAEIIALEKRNSAFAARRNLPKTEPTEDWSGSTLAGLDMAGTSNTLTSPAKGAMIFGIAEQKAALLGEDPDYFYCKRILALAQIDPIDAIIPDLEAISSGRRRPARSDIGIASGQATWRLMLYWANKGDFGQARQVWNTASAHDHASQSDTWAGLRRYDPIVDRLMPLLKSQGEHDLVLKMHIYFVRSGRKIALVEWLRRIWHK